MTHRYTHRPLRFLPHLTALFIGLLLTAATPTRIAAQCTGATLSEDVENVERSDLTGSGWEIFGTVVSDTDVINGQQSFLTSGANGNDPGDNRVIRSPYVTVSGAVCVSFAYEPISPGSNSFVRVVLINRNDDYYPLEEIDLSGVSSVQSYQRTFTEAEVNAAAPGIETARIAIEFNGNNAGGRRLIVDDVALSEIPRYDDGDGDYSNTAPTAVDDAYTAQLNLETTGNVLDNDADANIEAGTDAGPLQVSLVQDVSKGSLTLDADGSFSYTPSEDGMDSFTYEVCDNGYDPACSQATATFDTALPVELTAFDATTDGPSVVLSWQTATETNNAGFSVERRTDAGFQDVAYVEGEGTTTTPQSYSLRVNDLQPGTHDFRLTQVDLDGTTSVSPTVTATVSLQGMLTLTGAAPNPARTETTLRLGVQKAGPVTIELFDVLGRHVRTLYDGTPTPGRLHDVQIDASTLQSGRYLIRATSATRQSTQTLTVIR